MRHQAVNEQGIWWSLGNEIIYNGVVCKSEARNPGEASRRDQFETISNDQLNLDFGIRISNFSTAEKLLYFESAGLGKRRWS
jgi:hypothetical protein